MPSEYLVGYNCFFPETGLASTHWRDVILHAVLKMRTWVIGGSFTEWGRVGLLAKSPHFSNCMQNGVTLVCRSLLSFCKKAIVNYLPDNSGSIKVVWFQTVIWRIQIADTQNCTLYIIRQVLISFNKKGCSSFYAHCLLYQIKNIVWKSIPPIRVNRGVLERKS